MTKDVILTISGLHYEAAAGFERPGGPDDENEPIEVITPAAYYLKNGKHYIVYDEVVEGMPGTIKNKIKLTGDRVLEIMKSGISNTHLVFEKDKIHMTQYETPYGELMVGAYTRDIQVSETEERIDVTASYALDINGEKVADCDITMQIKAAQR